MPLDLKGLIVKSISIIKQDHYILYPAIITYFILNTLDNLYPLNAQRLAQPSSSLGYYLVALLFILICLQVFIICMTKSLVQTAAIDFFASVTQSLKKIVPVVLLSGLLLFPALIVLVLTAEVPVLRELLTVVSVWIILLILPVQSIIMINDDLTVVTTLYKLVNFIKMNKKSLFYFGSFYVLLVLLIYSFILMIQLTPGVGKNFLLPLFQGLQSTFLVVIVYVYYLNCNEKRC